MAIEPFAGHLAGVLFAVGILNAGFMGLVVVSLSTAYAFAEFFGLSGSLNDTYKESKTFYVLFIHPVGNGTAGQHSAKRAPVRRWPSYPDHQCRIAARWYSFI